MVPCKEIKVQNGDVDHVDAYNQKSLINCPMAVKATKTFPSIS